MADAPPNDLVPLNTTATPPADLTPVTPNEPAAEPEHARWDVIGSVKKAWQGAKAKLSGDAAASMDPKQIAEGAKAGDLPLSRLPGDVVGFATKPMSAFYDQTVGSALSYPVEAMDRLQGVKPGDYNKKIPGLAGSHSTLKDPQQAGEDIANIFASGAATPARGGTIAEAIRAAKPEVDAARAQRPIDSAARAVARRAEQDKVTPDAWEAAKANAAKTGDNLSLMDMGKNLRNLGGKVYRGPGQGGSILDTFLKARDKAVGPQLDKEIQSIAKGSTYDAINHLYGIRSEAAEPVFEQAYAHGSTAPFETMLQQHWADAGKVEQEATQRLQQARNAQTVLESKAATNSNIYSAPTPAERSAARQAVTEAEHTLEAVQAQKQRTKELLQRAQADGTANAPGATWSPRLEELRADPDIAAGLKRGLKIEKKNALAKGRPFHDRDHAITGWDEHGDPIVGAVPTMKAWAAAKEGMDAIVLDQVHPVGHTSAGRPTKEGLANRKLRDELRKELTTLNQKYGEAINVWAGPSESIDAVRMGQEHFTRNDTIEQVQDEFNQMTDANKEFYRLGAAEHLINKNKSVAIAGDESKAIMNSRKDEERLRVLFPDQSEANQFLDSVARKRQMFETKQKVAGGSDTAERIAEDSGRFTAAGKHLLTAAERAKRGHPLTAGREAISAGQALFTNKAKAEQIAKLYADPNTTLPALAPKQPLIGGPRKRTLDQLLRDARGNPQ